MGPQEGHNEALTTQAEAPAFPPRQPEYADPLAIGGSVLFAVILGVMVWVAVRAFAPISVRRPSLEDHAPPVEAAPVEVQRVAPVLEEAPPPEMPAVSLVEEPVGIVARLRQAMARTREALQSRLDGLFSRPLDAALWEELEEALLQADVGVGTTERILNRVREAAQRGDDEPAQLRGAMQDEMRAILTEVHAPLRPPAEGPWVILVVGVNGSGKTTTIGKLAARFQREGRKVMLAAADTYRAAASEQLQIWAERAGADIVTHQSGADPGAVVFDAMTAAARRGHDVVIVDTAGRLQTRKPLMAQLTKIRRVIQKTCPDGPHETLLVLDGTMGQNGLSQAKLFNEATPLTGVVVTKLDGTAKGGMVLTVASELSLPVKLIGIGEQVDDLRDFDAEAFVEALA